MIYDRAHATLHRRPSRAGRQPEDFQRNIPAVLEGKYATFVQTYVNMVDGLIVNIYDADNEQAVARELERIGFPFDEIQEMQFAASRGPAEDDRWMTLVRQAGRAGKRPLKVNVFEHMMAHQGMLEQLPLFPYFGPGDIVPTAALSLSLPDMPRVHFYHYNDIPEVILCMAGEGGLLATGQLYLQQGTHGVTTFLRKPAGAEGEHYQISLIIIRMKRDGAAERGFILRCPSCNEVVFRMDRDVWQGPRTALSRARQRALLRRRGRRIQRRAAHAARMRRRRSRASRRAHGWRRYAQYVELANRARGDIERRRGP